MPLPERQCLTLISDYSPGEIIPQAACKSYGLAIGAYAAPIVRLIIWLEYIIAKPISMVLDWALGDDHGVSTKTLITHQSSFSCIWMSLHKLGYL